MQGFEKKTLRTSRGLTYTYYITPSTATNSSNTPLLFQHGWPDSHRLWIKLLPYLETLPHRLIMPDMLGYGGTDKPSDPAALAYDAMATDMIEILDSERIDKVISIGHDHGSLPAQRLYNHYPDRVAAIVLLNVAYSVPSGDGQPFDLAALNQFWIKTFGYPLYEYWNFFALDPEAPRLMLENVDRVYEACHADGGMDTIFCKKDAWRTYLTDRSQPPLKLKEYAYDDSLRQDWIKTISIGGFETPLNWYKAVVNSIQSASDKKVTEENRTIRVPLLFIGTTGDLVCRKELIYAPQEQGLLPDLTVVEENAGHWVMLERPEAVSEHIIQFIKDKSL